MKTVMTVIFAFELLGCSRPSPVIKYYAAGDFILEDTCREANVYKTYHKGHCNYPIYYKGPLTDTIRTGRGYFINRTPWNNARYKYYSMNYAPSNLIIRVDTTVYLNYRAEYFSPSYDVLEDSTENIHAYLVTLQNISDSILYMGQTFALYYAWREAKNKKGEWVKIEKTIHETGLCTVIHPYVYLLPHEMIISKLPRYTGNFVTECRLAFGYYDKVVYSNTFRDSIDEKILISPYDNH